MRRRKSSICSELGKRIGARISFGRFWCYKTALMGGLKCAPGLGLRLYENSPSAKGNREEKCPVSSVDELLAGLDAKKRQLDAASRLLVATLQSLMTILGMRIS